MNAKKELRKVMKEKRDSLMLVEKDRLDSIIFQKIIESDYYKNSSVIFVYVSHKNEADTHCIINKAFRDNKIICVPKVLSLKEGMVAVRINNFEDLEAGTLGILEPKSHLKTIVNSEEIDLAIIPGLAFDECGGRLGYGGGFYDRFLRNFKKDSHKIAIAYNFQLISKVPMEQYDTLIDKVITD